MIGSIISGVAGIGGSILGGIKAGKERKKAQKALKKEQSFQDDLFNKEYYSDAMDRSDNASLLRNLRGLLNDQTKISKATAAITGSTPEQQVAQQESVNKALSDSASNIAALNSQYKDNVMNRYLNQRQNLYGQQQDIYNQSAQSWSNLMQNGLSTATGAASAIGGSLLQKEV